MSVSFFWLFNFFFFSIAILSYFILASWVLCLTVFLDVHFFCFCFVYLAVLSHFCFASSVCLSVCLSRYQFIFLSIFILFFSYFTFFFILLMFQSSQHATSFSLFFI